MNNLMDQYFDNMFVWTPFLERSQASAAVLNRLLVKQGSVPKCPHEREDLAACLAMQALFFKRVQQHEQSHKNVQMIIELLNNRYDTVLTSFSIATSYMFLAFVLTDEGELDRAAFYSLCVDAFLQKCKRTPRQPQHDETYMIREKYLHCMHTLVNHHRLDNMDLRRLLKIMVSCHFLNKKYRKSFQHPTHIPSLIGIPNDAESDFQKFMPFIDVILDDIDNNRNGFAITPAVVDLMTNKMRVALIDPEERGIMDLYFKRIGFYLIAQGAKLQCLLEEQRHLDVETRNVAEHIADMCCVKAFVYCWATVQYAVAFALQTMIGFLQATTDIDDQNRLVGKIRVLNFALKTLAQKYKVVMMKQGPLIESTDRIIHAHDEHAKLLGLYATLTHSEQSTIESLNNPLWNPVTSVKVETDKLPIDFMVPINMAAPAPPPPPAPATFDITGSIRLEDLNFELFLGDFFQDNIGPKNLPFREPTPQQDLFL
jgi:hypothetical protein